MIWHLTGILLCTIIVYALNKEHFPNYLQGAKVPGGRRMSKPAALGKQKLSVPLEKREVRKGRGGGGKAIVLGSSGPVALKVEQDCCT